ncbi:hypothetical protein FIU95_21440 (plasmid) [Microbulbifer sp. THAF38]|nr:hypothetical protein FIU95_21440 [Microbulbifer sp. THAF38]
MDDYEAGTTHSTGLNSRLGCFFYGQASTRGLFLHCVKNPLECFPHLLTDQLQQGGARGLIGTVRNPLQAGTEIVDAVKLLNMSSQRHGLPPIGAINPCRQRH